MSIGSTIGECPFTIPDGAVVEGRKHPVGSGVQWRCTFQNGWGASVVRLLIGPMGGSYGAEDGEWELAVLGKDGRINYDHPVSKGDARGRLVVEMVDRLLAEIAATREPK